MKSLKRASLVLAIVIALSCVSLFSTFATESTFAFDTSRVGYSAANVEKVTIPELTAENDLGKMNAAPTTAGTYYVSDKKGLDNLSAWVTAGTDFSGSTIVQTKIINMAVTAENTTAWSPIGTTDTDASLKTHFAGTYDGQGYAIINLAYSIPSVTKDNGYGVLFNTIKGATLKNIVLASGCSIDIPSNATDTSFRVGGIVGVDLGTAATISNCYSAANVTGRGYAGGIIGCILKANTKVEYCTNAGYIKGVLRIGGIVSYVGNVASTIENCLNLGTIETTTSDKTNTNRGAGGICCAPNNTTSKVCTIKNCVNYGVIISAGTPFAGGIIGIVREGVKASGNIDYGTVTIANTATPTTIYGGIYTGKNADGVDATNQVLRGIEKAKIHGYQIKETTNNTNAVDIRLVGSIDSIAYKAVGMEIIATYTVDGVTKVQKLDSGDCTTVFSSLNAMYAGQDVSFTAASLRGEEGGYLFAIVLENIPKGVGDITLTVTPYCKDAADSTVVYKGQPASGIVDIEKLPDSTLPTGN